MANYLSLVRRRSSARLFWPANSNSSAARHLHIGIIRTDGPKRRAAIKFSTRHQCRSALAICDSRCPRLAVHVVSYQCERGARLRTHIVQQRQLAFMEHPNIYVDSSDDDFSNLCRKDDVIEIIIFAKRMIFLDLFNLWTHAGNCFRKNTLAHC